jgi:hypothetical protein
MDEPSKNLLFEQALAFYVTNKSVIREKYLGKQVVISGDRILGAYDDVVKVYQEAIKTVPLGSFVIKDIPENIEDEVIYLPYRILVHDTSARGCLISVKQI